MLEKPLYEARQMIKKAEIDPKRFLENIRIKNYAIDTENKVVHILLPDEFQKVAKYLNVDIKKTFIMAGSFRRHSWTWKKARN